MRTVLIVILFLIGGLIGYVAGVYQYTNELPFIGHPSPTASKTNPTVAPTPSPSTTPAPKTTTAPTTQSSSVNFEFAVTDVSGSGLTRTITAQIRNAGTGAAHNVWGNVEVFSGTTRIKVNGQDAMRIDIGTMQAGQTINKQVDIQFSITDGLKLMQSGAKFVLTVHSNEKTQPFEYDYKP